MNGWILLSIYFSSGVGGKLNLHFPLMYNVVIIIFSHRKKIRIIFQNRKTLKRQ